MKKANKPIRITIIGDNNKVSFGESNSLARAITALAAVIFIAVAVLIVLFCYPEKLVDIVRIIIDKLVGG